MTENNAPKTTDAKARELADNLRTALRALDPHLDGLSAGTINLASALLDVTIGLPDGPDSVADEELRGELKNYATASVYTLEALPKAVEAMLDKAATEAAARHGFDLDAGECPCGGEH